MRLFLLFLTVFATTFVQAQNNAVVPTAEDILKPAYERAAGKNKNVLLIFHASWCGWCRKLDASLQDAAVKPLFDKSYEIVHLTVYESAQKKHLENKGALELLTKLGGAGIGLPYWFVLDKNGTMLADAQLSPGKNTGCPATKEEVAYFVAVLKQTSSLTAEELNVIASRFRMNE